MALIKCPDCGKEFSDAAVACPNCGRPHKQVQPVEVRETKKIGCFGAGCLTIIVLAVIGSIVGQNAKPPSGPPPGDVAKYVGSGNTPPADGWSVDRSTSTMDDSRTVILSLSASGPIEGWLKTSTPTLGIRCKEHKTEVYVHTGMAANPELGEYNQATVRLRLDSGTAFTQMWSEATNNEALFAPEPISLARRMARSKLMRFSFTPFQANQATAVFDVSGLGAHLPELARACGWQR